ARGDGRGTALLSHAFPARGARARTDPARAEPHARDRTSPAGSRGAPAARCAARAFAGAECAPFAVGWLAPEDPGGLRGARILGGRGSRPWDDARMGFALSAGPRSGNVRASPCIAHHDNLRRTEARN